MLMDENENDNFITSLNEFDEKHDYFKHNLLTLSLNKRSRLVLVHYSSDGDESLPEIKKKILYVTKGLLHFIVRCYNKASSIYVMDSERKYNSYVLRQTQTIERIRSIKQKMLQNSELNPIQLKE